MRPLLIVTLLFVSTFCYGSEADHCQRLARQFNAHPEVRMWDGTRADLLNNEYAFEVDYASKWAEGIGQALYYAQLTGRKPALILLTQKHESRFAYRAQTAGARSGVTVFIEWIQRRSVPPDENAIDIDEDSVDINIGPLNIHVPKGTPKVIDSETMFETDSTKAIRVYMIQHRDGRWLRRTVPGQINMWIVDQGRASVWTNKQEAHLVWSSLGYNRENAKMKTYLLVPVDGGE